MAVRDMFQVSNHCCLVMDPMRGTLLDLVHRPVTVANSTADGRESERAIDTSVSGKSLLTRPR